jgi:hypothetical protein
MEIHCDKFFHLQQFLYICVQNFSEYQKLNNSNDNKRTYNIEVDKTITDDFRYHEHLDNETLNNTQPIYPNTKPRKKNT